MEDFEIYALCIRIICSIIIRLSNMIKFQLTITCFLHSLSYIFPPVRPFFCEFQSMLNTFGELSKLAIATMIMLLAQLTLLIVFNTLIFIFYSILDVVNIKYTVANHWWGGVAIVNIITSPLFLIVFILSEDGKMKLIKDVLCCKKEENSNDIEI